jgi:chemotaxis protein methyltransferase CheR
VKIYGSDISKRCVAAARRGVYTEASFRAMPPDLKRRYFNERQDGFHVSDRVRAMCHFGQMNLLDEEKARLLGRADAVFCRNVLIYFDTYARRRVIDMFHERLYAGGVLLLGHSESLLNVSTAFELLHLKEDLVYKKPLGPVRDPKDPLRDSGKPQP